MKDLEEERTKVMMTRKEREVETLDVVIGRENEYNIIKHCSVSSSLFFAFVFNESDIGGTKNLPASRSRDIFTQSEDQGVKKIYKATEKQIRDRDAGGRCTRKNHLRF